MPDRDTLYRLYITEGKTTVEIAAMLGVRSSQTISNWLNKHRIPVRQKREAQRVIRPPYETVYELYVTQEKSIDEVSALLNLSSTTIERVLREYQIPRRSKTWKSGLSTKGKPLTEAQKRILSEYAKQRTGSKHPRYGVTLEPETRAKISQSLVGRFRKHLHPNWQDGGTSRYRRILSGQAEYDQWRRAVFARDNYTCQMCGKPSNGDIQAHHIHPVRSCPERIMDLDNGITLCELCHDSIRLKEAEHIERFEAIIRQSIL